MGAMASRPHAADRELLSDAVELAQRCPPSDTAFSVGAVIVADDGTELGRGWSRRHGPTEHAEEAALADVSAHDQVRLRGATIYTSLEPCARRASRAVTCTEHILSVGIGRIVFAWSEPAVFVDAHGADLLRRAGRTVLQIDDLAEAARAPNRHLLTR